MKMSKQKQEMSRKERLGRALLKLYGFTLKTHDELAKLMKKNGASSWRIDDFLRTCSSFAVKPTGPGVYWDDATTYEFDNWEFLLFGRMGRWSLNDHIANHAEAWKACKDRLPRLLKYKTLDELDILLTLAGCNTNPVEKAA